MKVKDILIIALAGVIVFLLVTRPKPSAPEKVNQSKRIVDSLQVKIDSLILERQKIIEQLKRDSTESARILKDKDVRIANLNRHLHELDIKSLPVPDLDSIVRDLYGPGSLPAD